jgi:ABC-type antimicrobial peptide transport system ATPase subunit
MEPLEQVTVVMTLMKRLVQVMDHERAVLQSMRLDALPDLQDEKVALAEAYEIEIARLRCSPEALASLEPHVRAQLHEAMCSFQESVSVNLHALAAVRDVVDEVRRNVGDSLARGARTLAYGTRGEAGAPEQGGQVIPVAFDRRV